MINRRGAQMVVLGLVLSGFLFGFSATPAAALSISGDYTYTLFGSPGTAGPNTGLAPGLAGPLGSGLVGGFPNTALGLGNNFWSPALGTGVFADPIGNRVDNVAGLTLSFPNNFFASGEVNNTAKYLAVHWTAAFSNAVPVTFTLAADDHAFLYIDGVLVVDAGGIKPISGPGPVVYSLTGNHTLDLFFADVKITQSGITFACEGCVDPSSAVVPEPATLLLFGTTLVGLGSVIRRRMKRASEVA